jgi:Asp-tRNA(Asn)/Glu-tRNA(Gln) amidotransferase A subunit family amidase
MNKRLAEIPFLPASELRQRLQAGSLRAVQVAGAFIDQIKAVNAGIEAFAWFDEGHVLDQARRRDLERGTGRPVGPLFGLPVAVKDIIDTKGIPTENGSPLDKGRVPRNDAAIVEKLKDAGAIIFGKAVTTELAFMTPSKTKNPHRPTHTAGGSSSGSAAAVAARMAPLAIGSQTGGSVIRPASFCGVVGFKPSYGAIPRTGMLAQSPTLDTAGVFANSVADAALLAEVLFGFDPLDPATSHRPPPRLFETATSRPPLKPVFAFWRAPGWEKAAPEMRAAMEELAAFLGDSCFEIELPAMFQTADEQRKIIHFAEMAKFYHGYEKRAGDQLGDILRQTIETGKSTPARDYIAALDWRAVLNAGLDEVFERCDAIILPAALGAAPADLGTTGDPIFNGLWTLCGTPAVTVPVFADETGMPMGLQLIGQRENDGRLLRTARWLVDELAQTHGQHQEVVHHG